MKHGLLGCPPVQAVEALPVVVDDPPDVADVVLRALEHRLEDVALVELGVADDRDHPSGRHAGWHEAVEQDVVLHKRGAQRQRHAQPDRARREVDLVPILRARRVGLRAPEGAEALELLARLLAEEVLDRVEDGARVRLDRHPVLRPQHVEVERGHDVDRRGRRGLVAAHLEAVPVRPHVVRVMDGPRREPEDLLGERAQAGQAVGVDDRRLPARARLVSDHRPTAWGHGLQG